MTICITNSGCQLSIMQCNKDLTIITNKSQHFLLELYENIIQCEHGGFAKKTKQKNIKTPLLQLVFLLVPHLKQTTVSARIIDILGIDGHKKQSYLKLKNNRQGI